MGRRSTERAALSFLAPLIKYLGKYKIPLFIAIFCAIAGTIFNIIGPTYISKLADTISAGLFGSIDFSEIIRYVITLIILYALAWILSYAQNLIMTIVTQKTTYNLRRDIARKINVLPLRYFDNSQIGDILSRVTNDVDTVGRTMTQSVGNLFAAGTQFVGVLIIMLIINWQMTLVCIGASIIGFALMTFIMKRSQKYFIGQQMYLGMINGHVEEMYGGHDVIKAFGREEASVAQFEEFNEKLCESGWKSQFLSGLMMPTTMFIGNLAYVMVCLLGGYLAIIGRISIGDIQAFIQYVRSFNQPITQVANIVNLLQSTAAAAERIFELIDEEEEEDPAIEDDIKDGTEDDIENGIVACDSSGDAETKKADEDRPAFAAETFKGEVTFDHVTFGYSPEETIINDFCFTAYPGQSIAIVGPTGAGKTTIVKLMMRFYELNSGRILVDGRDIRDYSRQDLRRLFGMVLQDTWLHSGTVRENIRYGRTDATDEEVEAAAKAAHIDFFIRTQPKGYDMEINEEANNISQGQKQLLTIARAILSDSPIMILDEATSSVDTRTEQQIQNAMDRLMKDRTSFVIAHRLSTIKGADHILVMDHGDIVEQGSHEELLAKDGFYAALYNSQFAG